VEVSRHLVPRARRSLTFRVANVSASSWLEKVRKHAFVSPRRWRLLLTPGGRRSGDRRDNRSFSNSSCGVPALNAWQPARQANEHSCRAGSALRHGVCWRDGLGLDTTPFCGVVTGTPDGYWGHCGRDSGPAAEKESARGCGSASALAATQPRCLGSGSGLVS
jgi:hypothetical protein